MEYFTETASTHREVLEKINMKYGGKAKILSHRTVRIGGFLGLFTREGVEISGYISQDIVRKPRVRLEDEKKKILDTVRSDATLVKVLEEVKSLKAHIESGNGEGKNKHTSIEKIENLLSENEFSFYYIKMISDRLKSSLTVDELEDYDFVQDKVVEWIGESILLDKEGFNSSKVVILVGPTGVGKTTTIAKLAAIHGIGTEGSKAKTVRMLTIDNYRIGAQKQIETYGEIMDIPVAVVETYLELQQKINLFSDADLILVDTIGKSPKDYQQLAEMRKVLDACGSYSEVYLAMSATTKVSDVKELLQQFEPFNYRSV
ncbi:MAG: flagellar biosynthesis protein FlhF, partial [Spirochaetes bacterium]